MRKTLAVTSLLAISGWLVSGASAATIVEAVFANDHARVAEALARGVDPNEPYRGTTALHLAAEWGYREIAEFLVKKRAEVDALDSLRKTPLLWAIQNDHQEIARMLLAAKADPNWQDLLGNSPLSEAAKSNQLELVGRLLREHGAKLSPDDLKPLRAAIDNRDAEIVRVLLEAGANPCGKPKDDIGPYYAAAVTGSVEILKIMAEYVGRCPDRAVLLDGFASAAEKGHLRVVEYLMSLNPPREKIVGALKEAFEDGQIPVVRFLIENAADLTAEDKGRFLADAHQIEPPLFQYLVDRGAALDTPNHRERTPAASGVL